MQLPEEVLLEVIDHYERTIVPDPLPFNVDRLGYDTRKEITSAFPQIRGHLSDWRNWGLITKAAHHRMPPLLTFVRAILTTMDYRVQYWNPLPPKCLSVVKLCVEADNNRGAVLNFMRQNNLVYCSRGSSGKPYRGKIGVRKIKSMKKLLLGKHSQGAFGELMKKYEASLKVYKHFRMEVAAHAIGK